MKFKLCLIKLSFHNLGYTERYSITKIITQFTFFLLNNNYF